MTWQRPKSIWLAPALLLALGAALILSDGFGLPSGLGNRLFDAWQRHAARAMMGPVPVRVLELPALDEDTLVQATRALAQQGARLVVFTAPMVPGPSPQSLAARLPPGGTGDAARAALARLPEPGHDLAAAIQSVKGVLPVLLGVAGRPPRIKARFVYRGTRDPFARVPRFAAAAAGPALLETNAAGSGAANLPPDADGVVRRMPLAFHLGAALVPGLAAETLRVADGEADLTMVTNERDPLSFVAGVGIAGLARNGRILPTDADGRIRLRYAANVSQRMLNPSALSGLKGAIVLVGTAGAVVKTPLGLASTAGVMAEGVEDLLGGTVLARPDWMAPAEALALVASGAAMTWLLRFGLGWPAALAMAAIAGLFAVSWDVFVQQGLLLDAATPSLLLLLAFAAGAAVYIQDLRLAHAGLRLAFCDSLPRATIEKIARRPGLLRLEGETRTVTFLVCGVRGLAALAAAHKTDAGGFTSLMRKVLTPLIDQALAHGGTIDRLTADGFAAFWNAPLDDADHALHACEAANGMAVMLARVNDGLAQPVEIGIGIATGPVIAGGFGGYGRMGYSVNGAAVALAGRVQALSHQYGPAVVVARETRQGADRGFAFLEVDMIASGSGDPPTALYAIMGNPVSRASPQFRALAVFHDHIFQAIRKQQWQMARELIAQCRRLSGASQKMYDLHLARIAYFEKHPPGADWDGAFRPILE